MGIFSAETGKAGTDMALAQGDRQIVRVLYIAGEGRSGSTLLGRLMGELDGFANVGEARCLFDPYLQDRLCGCGAPLRQCDFWNAVMQEAYGGFDKPDVQAVLAIKRLLERMRCVPKLMLARNSRRIRDLICTYREILENLYQAIGRVSGARVVVDTSKSTLYAYYLGMVSSVDLSVVHLLRDSRAVAYSFQRRKLNPAVHWKQHHMGTVKPTRVAAAWAVQNALMQIVRPGGDQFVQMRYEDVVQAPKAAVERICRLLGEPSPDARFLDCEKVALRADHTANGNPDRFDKEVVIKPDLEWRDRMALRDKAIVTCLTFPLLLLYGYGLGGARQKPPR